MSEVAVPGRTAHEGKPASHDTSVPSPPHPPEGAGTLGRYPGGLDQWRPPHPRRRPEAFAFLADAELRPNYQTFAAAWEFAHQMQESCIIRPGCIFLA